MLAKKSKRSPTWGEAPSILVIRRNRLGDMICTLPLIENLRGRFPKAKITVACDPIGAPIARACPLVNEVVVLRTASGLYRWTALIRDAAALQDFDWVIAVKGGFDLRLACLARWTNAPVRIGFGKPGNPGEKSRSPAEPDSFFTDVLTLPQNLHEEHQVDTQLRLLDAVGISRPRKVFPLQVPEDSRRFADQVLSQPPFTPDAAYVGQLSEWVREDHSQAATQTIPYILFNVSSTVPLLFPAPEQARLIQEILARTGFLVGVVSSPQHRNMARDLVFSIGSHRVVPLPTPGPMDLAALLERARLFITPEGGAAHLAAVTNTPTLVLWSEGPFKKWRSLNEKHVFLKAKAGGAPFTVSEVFSKLMEMDQTITSLA